MVSGLGGRLVDAPNVGARGVAYQASIGNTARTIQSKLDENVSALDCGAAANGTTDDKAAIATCDAAAATAGQTLRLTKGTYRIASNVTLASAVVFDPGAVIKPDASVTVTFSQNFQAGNSYQIFNLANSGALISLPYNLTHVWAEWWGAKGDATKTDNQIPINQALAAVAATASGGTGVADGTVSIGRGWFLISAGISIPNYTSLRGVSAGYTVIQANTGTWSGNQMFTATNGTSPMFDSRIENLRISANKIAAITYAVYSNAWQEKSGLRNVLLKDFMNYGVYYEIGYGGAAVLPFIDCEIFPDNTSSNSTGVFVTNTSSQGWLNVTFERTTIGTSNASPTNVTGVRADNRVNLILNGLHVEGVTNGFLLTTGASVNGAGVNGGAPTTNLFNVASGWTGNIAVRGARLGGATNMVVDSARSYGFAALEPYDGDLVWPPSPERPMAAALITGGASPVISYQGGKYSSAPFASVTHSSTGLYLVSIAGGAFNTNNIDVQVTSQDSATPMVNYSQNTTSSFYVTTRNTSGTLTDSAGFSIKLYSKG
ncbi:glycosyl hydrolase family 28-related protein [Ralstonia pickettii]|uniref:glycosyl hydrolase family 28-related protein n=2 Tax=Burkholderiaceae TaxID=119060 RepID=UPI0015F9F07F|nr:glycosyl hydrolase family 28-related protein [Ralstonia pickettii]MBX3880400.1 hypothetical protein [Ralstonia pickettii]